MNLQRVLWPLVRTTESDSSSLFISRLLHISRYSFLVQCRRAVYLKFVSLGVFILGNHALDVCLKWDSFFFVFFFQPVRKNHEMIISLSEKGGKACWEPSLRTVILCIIVTCVLCSAHERRSPWVSMCFFVLYLSHDHTENGDITWLWVNSSASHSEVLHLPNLQSISAMPSWPISQNYL